MSECITICDAVNAVGGWLRTWQTLISGLLALAAAIWAGRLLRRQIAQTEAFNRRQIADRHKASRAVLSLALSAIDELCRDAASQIAREFEIRDGFEAAFVAMDKGESRSRFEELKLSATVVSEMKGFVETLQGPKSVRHVAELMSSIQLLISRFNKFDLSRPNGIVAHELPNLLLDVAKVGLLNDKMYNYSRFVDDSFAIVGRTGEAEAWRMIHQKALGLIFDQDNRERYLEPLNDRVAQYVEQDRSPWIEKFEG